MQNSQIHTYFQTQTEIFEQNFELTKQDANEEAIHDMRVSIKRLLTLFKFLDFCTNQKFKFKKSLNYLTKIFKQAAKLRDIQISILIIQSLEESLIINLREWKKTYLKNEQKEKNKLKKKLNLCNQKKIISIFDENNKIIKSIQKVNDLDNLSAKYKAIRIHKINLLLHNNNKYIDYHKIRKQIKQISYLTEIENIGSSYIPELENIKQLAKLLGDWHDITVFLKYAEKKQNSDYVLNKATINQFFINKQQNILSNFNKNYSLL